MAHNSTDCTCCYYEIIFFAFFGMMKLIILLDAVRNYFGETMST